MGDNPMQHKTLKLTLIAALSIMPLGWVNAACSNILGQWAITYDEVYIGDTNAGVGNAIIDATTISYWGAATYQGNSDTFFLSGPYSVDPWCNVVWNYVAPDGSPGVVNGIIVNVDKMYFIFSNATHGSSGRVIAERLKQN